jgi:hypothetical protein
MKVRLAMLLVMVIVLLGTHFASADSILVTSNTTEGCFTTTTCSPSKTTASDSKLTFTGASDGPISLA